MIGFRKGIIDQLREINEYLLNRTREQDHELAGQRIIIEQLRADIEKWKPDRDKKGRFTHG